MDAEATTHDLLSGGFYTVAQAARLLRVGNRQRIYRWLRSSDGASEPVILRDYQPVNNNQELSFWDLIEVQFVEHFRSQGLSLQYLRKVAARARQDFRTKHPFALSKAKYVTDRWRIFEQTAAEEGIKTRELLTGQYEMYEAIEEVLASGIEFNPKTFLAEKWRPLENDCPNVVVDPRYAYGQPVIGVPHVPTAAIFRQWKAEKGDRKKVADWWGLEPENVDEAIEFEIRMAA